jgi:hypothetical protein
VAIQECVITTATNGAALACSIEPPFTVVQSSAFPSTGLLYKGCATMKSKLLQKKSYGANQSHEVVDGHQESIEDSSVAWRERENPPGRVNPAVDSQVRKVLPGLLKRNYRPAMS